MSRWTSVVIVLAAMSAFPARAEAAMWIVNSASDAADSSAGDGVCATSAGVCTLRAAIQEANAFPGLDTIEFSIGSGVQTISLGSALPAITSPVTINGTSQPGFSGSPIIVLNGNAKSGLVVAAGGSTLRGLVIVNFAGDGLELRGGGGNVIETVYIGIQADGATAGGNSGSGIVLQDSSNNRIGGTSIAQRNLISANTGKGNGGGILINGGTGNLIKGNFIGTDIGGMLDRGNEGRGIALNGSSGNTIGGPEAGAGNLIAGNRATGVRLLAGSANNLVQGNYLGVNKTLTAFIKNDRGVQVRGSNGNQIITNIIAGHVYDGVLIWEGASNNLVYSNLIAYNGQGPIGDATEAAFNGVLVNSGTGNSILSNIIYGNLNMGIELGNANGTTPNDAGDADTGANGFQNFPVLTSATKSATALAIAGTLNSTASASFIVQFFADQTCHWTGYGEGRYFLGHVVVTTGGDGNASFNVSMAPQQVQAGWVVSATATGPGGNTSEFSACVAVR
jgi:CSLREA domain-containing protein